MKKYDLNFRRYIMLLLGIGLFSLLLFSALFLYMYQFSIRTSNQVLDNMVSVIQTKYPEVTDQEILDILSTDHASSFFKDYGIDLSEVSAIRELNQLLPIFLLVLFFLCLFIFALIIYLFFQYAKGHLREIDKIVALIDNINHKVYAISLEDHNEDCYSLLKSELYKTTIMLKEQAENSNLEKDALKTALSDISHQIKTPLTSILIMLDTLTEHPNLAVSKRMEIVEDVRGQVQKIHFLVMTLLKLAKFDAGVIQMRMEPVQGNALFASILDRLEVLSIRKNITYQIDGDVEISGDFAFLEEAFLNILKNCIEASFQDGKILIRMGENVFYTKIEIQDFGKGIPKKDLPHIFERFFKSSTSSSESFGIGLSLAKKIVESHHGYISCYSEIGTGTTFEVKFMKNY